MKNLAIALKKQAIHSKSKKSDCDAKKTKVQV